MVVGRPVPAAQGGFLNELTEGDFCMEPAPRAARGGFLNELTEGDHLYGTSMAALS